MEPRTIVITGVTSGLGRALAGWYAKHGHRVAGCGRRAAALAELSEQLGPGHFLAPLDVADAHAVDAWADQVRSTIGSPNLVINNAALINTNAPLWEVPVDEFSRVVDVNIKGVYHVLRSFLPEMIQRTEGVVDNVSSGWGRAASAEVGPYCATKWAIEGMTKSLAEELPRGMAAVAVNPGIIHTSMLESCFGPGAAAYPSPEKWVERAAPFLLELGPADNGRSVTVPG